MTNPEKRVDLRTLWTSVVVLLAVAAVLAPSAGADYAWLAVVAPVLVGGALLVLAARVAALLVQAVRPAPEPIRIRADRDDRLAPQRVDLRGRPQHPRAPGCGR